ncbi:hypothetical protein HYV80_04715 [Candidatus Woesearchaeota archaeon]|nr:hypothetical protein [Candidatus Woesearchaeota archaeon]
MVKKEQDSELFFVQVRNPAEVRRSILETLKEIVGVLQSFEKFRQIRHEKIEKINHLRVQIRQANKMLGDLRGKLPQTNLRAVVVREAPAKKNHKKKKSKAPEQKKEKTPQKKDNAPPKKDMTEVEKLESQLSAIEGKLKNLI